MNLGNNLEISDPVPQEGKYYLIIYFILNDNNTYS